MKNFPLFFTVSVLTHAPAYVVNRLIFDTLGREQKLTPPWWLPGTLVLAVGGAVLSLVVFQRVRGQPIVEGLSKAFGRTLAVSFLVAVIVTVGLLLFVVPGIFAYAVLFVAVPAVIAEKVGTFRALARSDELTKKNRLRVVGIAILVLLPIVVVPQIFLRLRVGSSFATSLVQTLIIAFFAPFSDACSAVAYLELRRIKEGAAISELATVFD